MNLKHNTRHAKGLGFHELQRGEAYLSLVRVGTPQVYIAVSKPGSSDVHALVNVSTGRLVTPSPDCSTRYRHLPDAFIDTGT